MLAFVSFGLPAINRLKSRLKRSEGEVLLLRFLLLLSSQFFSRQAHYYSYALKNVQRLHWLKQNCVL